MGERHALVVGLQRPEVPVSPGVDVLDFRQERPVGVEPFDAFEDLGVGEFVVQDGGVDVGEYRRPVGRLREVAALEHSEVDVLGERLDFEVSGVVGREDDGPLALPEDERRRVEVPVAGQRVRDRLDRRLADGQRRLLEEVGPREADLLDEVPEGAVGLAGPLVDAPRRHERRSGLPDRVDESVLRLGEHPFARTGLEDPEARRVVGMPVGQKEVLEVVDALPFEALVDELRGVHHRRQLFDVQGVAVPGVGHALRSGSLADPTAAGRRRNRGVSPAAEHGEGEHVGTRTRADKKPLPRT